MRKQPDHEIRLGLIKATISKKRGREPEYSIKIVRLYHDGKWRESSRFKQNDLLVAAKALDMAYSWIADDQVEIQEDNGQVNKLARGVPL